MTKELKGTVAVIGLGYVGLPLALLSEKKGYSVIGIDINAKRVNDLKNHIAPFCDNAIAQQLKTISFEATTDFSRVKEADTIIICVPTPVFENHMPDLRPIEGACKNIAAHLQKGQLIILESTVNPGVCETVILPLLEKISGLNADKDFYLAHCPERVNPGDAKWNVENIPRVIGSLEKIGLKKATEFYTSILSGTIMQMASIKEAEAVKVVENAFRDINIAFVNELAMSFSSLGIDVINVIEGAATKPFSFMAHFPGCGVGGHCIPVDPYYLIEYAKQSGFNHDFLSLARRINNQMPAFTVKQLLNALREKNISLTSARVALLGLAYKPNVDDTRESPAFEIIKELKKHQINFVTFDPHVPTKSTVKTLEEALKKVDAIIIVTAHNEFKVLTPEDLRRHNISIIIDGRNCLNKEAFVKAKITYRGIGR